MALAKPPIIDDPLQARCAPASEDVGPGRDRGGALAPAQERRDAAAEHEEGDQGRYDGSPKVAVSMRATKGLWDGLGALSRRLEDEGMRTSRTELTEAMWHFNMPQSTAEARDLVRRYRSERAARA